MQTCWNFKLSIKQAFYHPLVDFNSVACATHPSWNLWYQ